MRLDTSGALDGQNILMRGMPKSTVEMNDRSYGHDKAQKILMRKKGGRTHSGEEVIIDKNFGRYSGPRMMEEGRHRRGKRSRKEVIINENFGADSGPRFGKGRGRGRKQMYTEDGYEKHFLGALATGLGSMLMPELGKMAKNVIGGGIRGALGGLGGGGSKKSSPAPQQAPQQPMQMPSQYGYGYPQMGYPPMGYGQQMGYGMGPQPMYRKRGGSTCRQKKAAGAIAKKIKDMY